MDYMVILALLTGAIGLMLFVIGAIFTAVVALGNKHYIFGWLTFLCLPVSLVYVAMHWQKVRYSGKMVYAGTGLLSVTGIILYFGGVFNLMFA